MRAKAGAPELRQPAIVVGRDDAFEALTLDPDGHVALYAELVLQGQEGLIELVLGFRDQDGELRMRSRRQLANYFPADGAGALIAAAARARGRGEELFVTPLPRSEPEPGKHAARAGSVVWVDVDGEPEGSELGRMAALRPHLTVHSGGGVHCYWRLERDQEPAEIESLNRRLCRAIGGDPACTDRGRIMRLPGSFNGKRGRWCRVLRADRSRALLDPDQVRQAFRDPDPPRPAPAPPSDGHQGDDELALIAPPDYFRALAGVEVPVGSGMIRCPLPGHEDQHRSCQVWPEPERGWPASAGYRGFENQLYRIEIHDRGHAGRGDVQVVAAERLRRACGRRAPSRRNRGRANSGLDRTDRARRWAGPKRG